MCVHAIVLHHNLIVKLCMDEDFWVGFQSALDLNIQLVL